MKNLFYLFLFSLLITSCDECNQSEYEFKINYELDVLVPKETINNSIGKAVSISKDFQSRVYEDVMAHYLEANSDYVGYSIYSMELYYFWLRLKGDYPGNFNFMESVTADCYLENAYQTMMLQFPMTTLTFPEADDNSFKINEKGVFVSNWGGDVKTFTVVLSFVPKEEVAQDVTLSWDFTFQYLVELVK
jgi:hypothetical protein